MGKPSCKQAVSNGARSAGTHSSRWKDLKSDSAANHKVNPVLLACMTLMGSTCGLRISISRLRERISMTAHLLSRWMTACAGGHVAPH